MNPYTLTEAETELRIAIDAGDQATIDRLGATVDAMETTVAPVAFLAAALWYAEQGLKVFPLQPHTKIPFKGSNGCKGATTDPELIRRWWEGNPQANIGIATGQMVDVIDIDGLPGVVSYLQVIDDLPPVLGKVSTPRPGGTHLYVAAVPGRTNRAGLLNHVDYRADGGYVVAPPSVNEQGSYVWRTPLDITTLAAGAAA